MQLIIYYTISIQLFTIHKHALKKNCRTTSSKG